MQILTKKIVVNTEGEIIDYNLNSPFAYLRNIVDQGLDRKYYGSGSEQLPPGACRKLFVCLQQNGKTTHSALFIKLVRTDPNIPLDQFLSMMRFDQRGKMEELVTERNTTQIELNR